MDINLNKTSDEHFKNMRRHLKDFFLIGFNMARLYPEWTEYDASKYFSDKESENDKERDLISNARSDVGHKITETRVDPEPRRFDGGGV